MSLISISFPRSLPGLLGKVFGSAKATNPVSATAGGPPDKGYAAFRNWHLARRSRATYAYYVRVYGDQERNRQRYAIEKLHLAISTLVGTGSVRERLAEAYLRHLSPVSAKDFPEELREEYRELITTLSWVPVEYEGQGTLRSTSNAMSDEKAVMLARRLVGLYYDLVEYYFDGR